MLYQIIACLLILSSYVIYLGKKIIQQKKGIQTDYIAKGKKRKSINMINIVYPNLMTF
jgi:hypothetical protein